MKLVTFSDNVVVPAESVERTGILLGPDVLDLGVCFPWLEKREGRDASPEAVRARYGEGLLGFIERNAEARPAADALVLHRRANALPDTHDGRPTSRPLAHVKLLAPLPRPPSMRDGYAFRQHVETARKNRGLEMIPEFDAFPVFYFTNHQAVVGPGELRVQKKHLERLDFELEAAIVVGKRGMNVPASRADEFIFGMTILNDFSARGLQMEEMKLSLGPAKGKDFATGLGPHLVTLDELLPRATKTPRGHVFDMEMRAYVNGVKLSQGNVKDMSWTFAQILERASYGAMLYPGDVVGSGTCGTGCFLELNGSKITANQWLEIGDTVSLEIQDLGRLEHVVALGDDAPFVA